MRGGRAGPGGGPRGRPGGARRRVSAASDPRPLVSDLGTLARSALLRSGVQPRARRTGGGPFLEGAPPSLSPGPRPGEAGAWRARGGTGGQRGFSAGPAPLPGPPHLFCPPGPRRCAWGKRGRGGGHVPGSAWRPGRPGPRAPGRCPAWRRGPAPAALRPGLRCPRAPGSLPRRTCAGRGAGASLTGSLSEQPTCRGSPREASAWELVVGRGATSASFPEVRGSRLIFLFFEWGSPPLLTGNRDPSLLRVPDTARFHTPAPPPGLGSALGKQGRSALAPVPWPLNQCPHSPRVPEPSTKRHSPLLLTFRELPAAALLLEVPCSPSCVNDYALVYLPHGRAA